MEWLKWPAERHKVQNWNVSLSVGSVILVIVRHRDHPIGKHRHLSNRSPSKNSGTGCKATEPAFRKCSSQRQQKHAKTSPHSFSFSFNFSSPPPFLDYFSWPFSLRSIICTQSHKQPSVQPYSAATWQLPC